MPSTTFDIVEPTTTSCDHEQQAYFLSLLVSLWLPTVLEAVMGGLNMAFQLKKPPGGTALVADLDSRRRAPGGLCAGTGAGG